LQKKTLPVQAPRKAAIKYVLLGKDRILAKVRNMAKVTSKYQVTLPKAIANKFKISPGDEIEWVAAGETIRVIPSGKHVVVEERETRLRLFDQATQRLRRTAGKVKREPRTRGWSREDLYTRGRSH